MRIVKRLLLAAAALVLLAAAAGYGLYAWNATPVVPAVSAADADSGRPYVIKLHAQWCPSCMMTKDVWSRIERAYAGRVNLVVLDLTDDATIEAARAEAARLGLQAFFDDYGGATGSVVVLDGRTKAVKAAIAGSRDFDEYRAAIDEALR